MKSYSRIILAALMMIISAGVAQAELRFGIKAGLNLNSLSFGKVENLVTEKDNRCGFTGGVTVDYTVPIIGIGVDGSVMYTRMNSYGAVHTDDLDLAPATPNENNASIGKNFIEIPINVKYKLGIPVIARIFKPYVFTGPSFAFKLDKNTLKDIQTKTCQVAWNIGLGIELINHLQVQASYGFGINNIADGFYGIQAADDVKLKNNYWTVTAAWLF